MISGVNKFQSDVPICMQLHAYMIITSCVAIAMTKTTPEMRTPLLIRTP